MSRTSQFRANKDCYAFPTKTVCYHMLYACRHSQTQVTFARSAKTETKKTTVCMYAADKSKFTGVMFPDSSFIAELEKLGFSNNNGITNLMPIVMYCSDE